MIFMCVPPTGYIFHQNFVAAFLWPQAFVRSSNIVLCVNKRQ